MTCMTMLSLVMGFAPRRSLRDAPCQLSGPSFLDASALHHVTSRRGHVTDPPKPYEYATATLHVTARLDARLAT